MPAAALPADVAERNSAVLAVAPHARRVCYFDTSCRLEVANNARHADATHDLIMLAKGTLKRSHRVSTQTSSNDWLVLRLRRAVPPDIDLRVTASAEAC